MTNMAHLDLKPYVTRVQDSSGFVGTVLYVGPVASAKSPDEIYAGISWDDVTRGKHDGSVICRTTNEIVRHFKCGPTQGSFLRLSKVDTGVPLTLELMRSRYVKPDAELIAPGNLLPHVARTSSGREKPIEFWGEVKIRSRQQIEVVEEISLRMLGISRPCDMEDRGQMEEFSHLTGIDLAGNLLSNWEDVLEILRLFPYLQSASLASNRINDVGSLDIGELTHLRALNLNNCNIGTFTTVQLVGQSMPNLEDLCLAHANLSDIQSCTSHDSGALELNHLFQNLVLLDLSDCHLTSWESQIQPFHSLPKLESLVLNDNTIEAIIIPTSSSDDEHASFQSLASLQLAGNPISRWTALDDLNNISALRSLRLRNTPLTEKLGVGEVRSTAIARFSNLEFFNASPISERERVEAERRYVSTVARELLLLSSEALLSSVSKQSSNQEDMVGVLGVDLKQADVYARHPRFQDLVSKHKETMSALTTGSGSSQGGQLGEDIINVTIRSMAAGSCDLQPLQKRLPRSLQVGRIKAMCARAFGVDVHMQILHFRVEVSLQKCSAASLIYAF
jgi:Leucine-rich repeat (LRR) protein